MNKLTIAFVAGMSILSLAACKKKGGAGDTMEKLESFQKQMCDCKDKACADKVQDDLTKWSTDASKSAKMDDKADPEMAKKSEDLMAKYTECMTKLTMGGDMKSGDMHGDMKGGDMKGGDMHGDMKGGDMKGGDMHGDMKGGDMKGSDMKGGDMKGSDMKGGDMKGGDMKGSDMKGGDMKGTK